jgi:four helix bundle protein
MYKTFEDMPVWQKAMDLAVRIFEITEKLPKKEDYGLTSQIRRSALSVSANIAESFGRKHTLDKLNFYYHSRGSLTETKSHLIYGNRVKYFHDSDFTKLNDLIQTIWKEINHIVAALQKKTQPQP